MVPLGAAGRRPRGQRPAGPDPVQHVPRRPDQRQRGARASARARRSPLMRAAGRATSCCRSMAYEWTELAYLELQAGNTAMIVFGFAVVMVFLVLAAQYESWSLPLAIILVVPMCLLSADRRGEGRGPGHQHLHPDRLRRAGRPGEQERDPDRRVRQAPPRRRASRAAQATLDACRLRLRPIIMTSLAFILGVVPLMPRPRGRGRDAADAGDDRLQRDARRDALRHLPDARLLLRDRLAGRVARLPPRRGSAGSPRSSLGDPHAQLPAGDRRRRPSRPSPRPSPRRDAAPTEPAARRTRRPRPNPNPSRSNSWSRSETIPCSRVLHRPADLRLGALDHHHPGRRHRRLDAADRAVSRHHPADGRGLGRTTPAPTPRWSPTPSPRRSSSRSTASRT